MRTLKNDNGTIGTLVDDIVFNLAEKVTAYKKTGKNLFNISDPDCAIGYYLINTTGAITANASYNTSGFIPVIAGNTYTQSVKVRMAWYTAAKVYISGTATTDTALTHVAPANAAYLRIDSPSGWASLQVEDGSVATAWEAYKEWKEVDPIRLPSTALDAVGTENIKDSAVTLKKTNFIATGKNLFDKSTVTVGYVMNQGTGVPYVNATYSTSDYIPILPSTNYTESTGYYLAFYNSSKTFISGLANGTSPRTITSPSTAAYIRCSMTSGPGVNSFQIELGSVATPYESYGHRLSDQLPQPKDIVVELTMPPKIYAIVGQELNIYYDNICNDRDTKYTFSGSCPVGAKFENYFRVNPIAAGTFTYLVNVAQDRLIKNYIYSSLIVSAASVGNGINKKVLVIGDSTTANGVCMTKLNANFDTDVMDITLLGTQGTAPNKHEGRSGWTASQFVAVGSPFVFAGVFDFAQYLSVNGITTPDYVIINLGISDMFGFSGVPEANAEIPNILARYQIMIDSIKSAGAGIKIGIALTIPPSYDHNPWGKLFGMSYSRENYKLANWMFVKALTNQFQNQEAGRVYIVPVNTNLDTRYNMGLESLPVNARNAKTIESIASNGHVHPSTEGYWQIADCYWFFLKSFEV
jgi:lysophospholipase L1-like esterase